MQVENRFEARRIFSLTAKYTHVVATLTTEIADAVDKLLAGISSTTVSDDLNRMALQRLEPLEQNRLRQLLSEKLGDERPSPSAAPVASVNC